LLLLGTHNPRERHATENSRVFVSILLAGVPLACLGVLVRKVHKFNFLQIGRQSNLIYAVVLAFVALLYLSLVRRISLWLEPTFPPEATAAILLFLPVVFFEPLQRVLRTTLRKTAHSEMDLTHRMMGPIQDVARLGNFAKLVQFVELWVQSQFQFARVQLIIDGTSAHRSERPRPGDGAVDVFTIQKANEIVGYLRVISHGAMLSEKPGPPWNFSANNCPQPSISAA